MSVVQRTLGHTALYAVALMLNRGIAFALIPMYTRVLDTPTVANWELSITTVLFLTPLFELGLTGALVRFYHQYDEEAQRRATFNVIFTSLVILSALLMGAGVLCQSALAGLIFGDETLGYLVVLVFVVASLTALANQPLSWFRAAEKPITFGGLSLIRAAAGPVAIIICVVKLDMGVAGILLGEAIGLAAQGLGGLALCAGWVRPLFDFSMLRPCLRFSLPMLPVVVGTVALTSSDRYFLKAWHAESLALFAVGAKGGIIVQFLTRALQMAFPPAAFRIAKEPGAPETFEKLLRIMLVGLFALVVVLSAFGPEVLAILGPPDVYGAAVVVIPWIALGFAVHAAVYSVMTGLSIQKRTEYVSLIVCTAGAAKLLFNYLLIHPYGMYGAAAATFLAFLLEFILAYAVSYRIYPVPHRWGLLALLWVVLLAVLGGITAASIHTGAIALGGRMALLLLFLLLAWFVFLRHEDRAELLGGLAKLRKRLTRA